MSQNLDLDITTSNITTEKSDVTTDWTASSTYPARATTTSVTTGSTTTTETYSWDLGQYVINAPTATTSCGNNATGLSGCSMFADVTGWTASDDPNFYRTTEYAVETGGVTEDCEKPADAPLNVNATGACRVYDAHYLVGNYYQWNAATAGTGASTANLATAAGSICPKGWKLPSSGMDQLQKGSFNYMLLQYGLANEDGSTYSGVIGTSGVNGNTYNIALSPLFWVRAGGVYSSYTTEPFRYAGSDGDYWSSRAYSSTNFAYNLYFDTSVFPSYRSNRYSGLSLRCLIPTP